MKLPRYRFASQGLKGADLIAVAAVDLPYHGGVVANDIPDVCLCVDSVRLFRKEGAATTARTATNSPSTFEGALIGKREGRRLFADPTAIQNGFEGCIKVARDNLDTALLRNVLGARRFEWADTFRVNITYLWERAELFAVGALSIRRSL